MHQFKFNKDNRLDWTSILRDMLGCTPVKMKSNAPNPSFGQLISAFSDLSSQLRSQSRSDMIKTIVRLNKGNKIITKANAAQNGSDDSSESEDDSSFDETKGSTNPAYILEGLSARLIHLLQHQCFIELNELYSDNHEEALKILQHRDDYDVEKFSANDFTSDYLKTLLTFNQLMLGIKQSQQDWRNCRPETTEDSCLFMMELMAHCRFVQSLAYADEFIADDTNIAQMAFAREYMGFINDELYPQALAILIKHWHQLAEQYRDRCASLKQQKSISQDEMVSLVDDLNEVSFVLTQLARTFTQDFEAKNYRSVLTELNALTVDLLDESADSLYTLEHTYTYDELLANAAVTSWPQQPNQRAFLQYIKSDPDEANGSFLGRLSSAMSSGDSALTISAPSNFKHNQFNDRRVMPTVYAISELRKSLTACAKNKAYTALFSSGHLSQQWQRTTKAMSALEQSLLMLQTHSFTERDIQATLANSTVMFPLNDIQLMVRRIRPANAATTALTKAVDAVILGLQALTLNYEHDSPLASASASPAASDTADADDDMASTSDDESATAPVSRQGPPPTIQQAVASKAIDNASATKEAMTLISDKHETKMPAARKTPSPLPSPTVSDIEASDDSSTQPIEDDLATAPAPKAAPVRTPTPEITKPSSPKPNLTDKHEIHTTTESVNSDEAVKKHRSHRRHSKSKSKKKSTRADEATNINQFTPHRFNALPVRTYTRSAKRILQHVLDELAPTEEDVVRQYKKIDPTGKTRDIVNYPSNNDGNIKGVQMFEKKTTNTFYVRYVAVIPTSWHERFLSSIDARFTKSLSSMLIKYGYYDKTDVNDDGVKLADVSARDLGRRDIYFRNILQHFISDKLKDANVEIQGVIVGAQGKSVTIQLPSDAEPAFKAHYNLQADNQLGIV